MQDCAGYEMQNTKPQLMFNLKVKAKGPYPV